MTEHLLESTFFVACVWGATLMLARQAAALRYRLWLAASLKFVVPLTPLVAVGRRFAWRAVPLFSGTWLNSSSNPGNMDVQSMPLATRHGVPTAIAHASTWSIGFATLVIALWAVWAAGSLVVLAGWYRSSRRFRMMLREATPLDASAFGVPISVRVLTAAWSCEPAVVGVWRPAIVLPADIESRLTAEQLESVVAHELCHIRRRDNLVAAAHLLIEAMFWFHPFVWLIERRLVEEREQACDEAVLGRGVEPETYAEAILAVCRHYICAPTLARAGVTGASLRHRVERIVQNAPATKLSGWRRAALVSGAAILIALPIAVGAATGTTASAQSPSTAANAGRQAFEVVSIKPDNTGRSSWGFTPGRLTGTFTVKTLMSLAFGTPPSNVFPAKQIVGGPDWLDTAAYAIKGEISLDGQTDAPNPIALGRPLAPLLRSLLEDRFKLAMHMETREFPVYALVLARSDKRLGPKLHRSALTPADCEARRKNPSSDAMPCGAMRGRGDLMTGVPVSRAIALLGPVDRPVLDRTGLDGLFDMQFQRDETISIFTDVQEQLGLKLESRREPRDVIVVDHVERPTPD